ncbi:hypothetical protein MHO82_21010 [Vibrio sp. Of7-15]|uniref:hypothetical protein n=1 Tax=Vibrio sp. Of7-15 TaxID=2724879 RepID=UPI001EF3D5F1|nr:hypothetical protein [Vibrio sp. Of7-15]MCG7499349.1 hypothetical protein [Vibrio sp. Of7-15]
MSELEQAAEMREEARQLLKQSNSNLEQSKRFSDLALTNQRRMLFAMSSLLPKPVVMNFELSSGDDVHQAEQVADAAEELRAQMKNREVFDIVHAINVLAMANTDVLHVMVQFSGHVNTIGVRAYPSSTKYEDDTPRQTLLDADLSLDFLNDEEILSELLAIESQLTELIIEAREAAETEEEVEA